MHRCVHAPFFPTGEEILYGTTDGKLGLVQVGEQSPAAKWEISSVKKKGGMLLFTHIRGVNLVLMRSGVSCGDESLFAFRLNEFISP